MTNPAIGTTRKTFPGCECAYVSAIAMSSGGTTSCDRHDHFHDRTEGRRRTVPARLRLPRRRDRRESYSIDRHSEDTPSPRSRAHSRARTASVPTGSFVPWLGTGRDRKRRLRAVVAGVHGRGHGHLQDLRRDGIGAVSVTDVGNDDLACRREIGEAGRRHAGHVRQAVGRTHNGRTPSRASSRRSLRSNRFRSRRRYRSGTSVRAA